MLDQRPLHLAEDAFVEAGLRQAVAVEREVPAQVHIHRFAERFRPFDGRRHVVRCFLGDLREFSLHDFVADRVLGIKSGDPADEVFEFAHIARPGIGAQPAHRLAVDGLGAEALPSRDGKEMGDELRDVLAALAQRRHAQGHDVQPVEEVFAKQSLPDGEAQVAMCRRHDADIGAERLPASDARVFAFLQHAQKPRLRFHRHVADLVEEERAAFRLLEAPGRALRGAGEGAALMPEQFGLDKVLRDRGHVDGNERTVAPAAIVVQGARDQLLSRPGLARNRHRKVHADQPGDDPVDFLHRRRAADQGQAVGLVLVPLDGLLGERGAQGPRDNSDQLRDVERLGQIFECAPLRRRDGGLQGRSGAHHDDAQFRPSPANPGHKVEAVLVRHHHVGYDQVALAVLHPVPEGRGIAGCLDLVAGPSERMAEHGAHGAVVVGD